MFQSTESRPALAILAVPAFALLLAGGASLQSRPASAALTSGEATVQLAEAGVMDLAFVPSGYAASAPAVPTTLAASEAGVMDLGFVPEAQTAVPASEVKAPTATSVEVSAAGVMDLGFTVSAS